MRRHDETLAEPIDGLMVEAVHRDRLPPEDLSKTRALQHPDLVRALPAFGPGVVIHPRYNDRRDVLDQGSSARNV